MVLEDRLRRPVETAPPGRNGPFGSREDALIVVAGTVITAGVLYDIYRRQTRRSAT